VYRSFGNKQRSRLDKSDLSRQFNVRCGCLVSAAAAAAARQQQKMRLAIASVLVRKMRPHIARHALARYVTLTTRMSVADFFVVWLFTGRDDLKALAYSSADATTSV